MQIGVVAKSLRFKSMQMPDLRVRRGFLDIEKGWLGKSRGENSKKGMKSGAKASRRRPCDVNS